MIISSLNLLSPFKKDRLEKLIKFIFIKNILEMALIIFAILATSLIWSWLLLVEQYDSLSQTSLLVNRTYSAYNQEIKQINRLIKDVNFASASYLSISPKLLELAEILPPEIKLNALEIDQADGTFVISGIALTRDDFLSWQQKIGSLTWLEGIQTPASQLFQKENISFEIKAKLKNLNSQPNETNKKTTATNNSEGW